jgi:hypothetical protein
MVQISTGVYGGCMKRLILFLALSGLIPALLFAENLPVDLRFEPASTALPAPALLAAVKSFKGVRIQPFVDKRSTNETLMGTIRIGSGSQMIQSKTPVSDFASDAFRKVYEEWGGKISPEGPLVLKGDVDQFVFDDYDGYQAKVGIHFFLCDESDRVLWDGHSSGIVRGTGKTFSRETLSGLFSDVLRATYNEMLEDEKLVGVWSGKVSNTYVVRDDAPSLSAKNRR